MSDRMCSLAICVIGLARGFAVHLQVTFLDSSFVFNVTCRNSTNSWIYNLENQFERDHRTIIVLEWCFSEAGKTNVFLGFILLCVKAYKTLITQLPSQNGRSVANCFKRRTLYLRVSCYLIYLISCMKDKVYSIFQDQIM